MDWKAWFVAAILGAGAVMSFWDGRRTRWQPGLLSQEQAKAIIEAEIRQRGWDGYDRRNYELERRKGQPVWLCRGFVGYKLGGVMVIAIDARTGELIEAKAGGR